MHLFYCKIFVSILQKPGLPPVKQKTAPAAIGQYTLAPPQPAYQNAYKNTFPGSPQMVHKQPTPPPRYPPSGPAFPP